MKRKIKEPYDDKIKDKCPTQYMLSTMGEGVGRVHESHQGTSSWKSIGIHF